MISKISVALVAMLATFACAATIPSGPPSPDQAALMARYIVNQADWSSVATTSVRANSKGYPFVNLISISDGRKGEGAGVPYLFITPLDFTGQDLKEDTRGTMMMSLVQGTYCNEKGYDPMDPRCARVILSGKFTKLTEKDHDFEVSKSAMFERHPWLAHMPPNHHFYTARFDIETIAVLAKFGGIAWVDVDDYYNVGHKSIEEYTELYK